MGRTKIMPDGSIKQCPVETLEIDKSIVKLSNKKNPTLLVIGTASRYNDSYFDVVKYHFENRLNCKVERFNESIDIESQIMSADIIYISGGDTRYMLQQWKKTATDNVLIKAYNAGIIIAGCSAGAICWFDYYDNFDYEDETNFEPKLLNGLGLIKGLAVPHYDAISENQKIIIKKLSLNIKNVYNIKNVQSITFKNEKVFQII